MKKFLFALCLVVLFSVATASPTYAAENPFQKFFASVSNSFQRLTLLLPGDKDGKIVMNQAVQANQKLKSANVQAVMTFDLQKQDNSIANVKVNLDGPFEMNSPSDPSSYKQALHTAATFSMEGTSLSADADLKVTKDFLYFKLNQVPAVPLFDLSSLKGKWLKTENKPTESSTSLSADQQQRMKDATTKLFMDAHYGSAKKETKNGVGVYVLDVTLPKQSVVEYIKTVNEIQKENSKDVSPQMEADEQKSTDSLNKAIDNIGDLTATLWVDRSSFYLTHMDLPITYLVEKKDKSADSAAGGSMTGSGSPLAALDEVDKVKMLFTIDLKDFNQSVSFEEPQDAQDAKEAFQDMMGKAAVTPPSTFGVGSSELPGLTPTQKAQLQKYEQMKQQMNTPDVPTATPAEEQ
jgi:hypothetical protein